MANLPAIVAAAVAVFLFVTGVIAMTIGELRIAGFSFLFASIVIYVRESRFVD